MSEVGRAIRKARVASGMSVPKLAGRAGLSTQTVYLIESGEAVGKLDTLEKLAKALGYTVHVELRKKK